MVEPRAVVGQGVAGSSRLQWPLPRQGRPSGPTWREHPRHSRRLGPFGLRDRVPLVPLLSAGAARAARAINDAQAASQINRISAVGRTVPDRRLGSTPHLRAVRPSGETRPTTSAVFWDTSIVSLDETRLSSGWRTATAPGSWRHRRAPHRTECRRSGLVGGQGSLLRRETRQR